MSFKWIILWRVKNCCSVQNTKEKISKAIATTECLFFCYSFLQMENTISVLIKCGLHWTATKKVNNFIELGNGYVGHSTRPGNQMMVVHFAPVFLLILVLLTSLSRQTREGKKCVKQNSFALKFISLSISVFFFSPHFNVIILRCDFFFLVSLYAFVFPPANGFRCCEVNICVERK